MWNKTFAIGITFLWIQCTVSDDERCPDGFTYRHDTMSCHKDEDTSQTPLDASIDGGEILGIGNRCTSDNDCEYFEADYCALSPMTATGFCTIKDCTPGACPGGYTCCDCRESLVVDKEKACIQDEFISQLQSLAGCSC